MYGKLNDSINWNDWINDCKKIIEYYGYQCNFLEIESKNMNSGKILIYKRNLNKVKNEIRSTQKIEYIGFYSISKEFDYYTPYYDVYVICNKDFSLLTVNESDFLKVEKNIIIEILKKYRKNSVVEIFKMDRDECPSIYAHKFNPISYFKTLEHLEIITNK